MPAGRPRKPKALKVFEGNRSREKLDYDEPEAKGTPKKPQDLDSHASWLWVLVVPDVVTWGAGESDAPMLESMCRWWGIYRTLSEKLEDPEQPYDFRAMIGASTAWKMFEKAASQFGLSPVARTKLRTPEKKVSSKWEDLLA